MAVIVRSALKEDGKYYPQVFLDDCLYDLKMVEYDRIGISEEIDINKRNASKECDIFHYWYFLDKNLKGRPNLCNACHHLMQKTMNFNDTTIVSVIGNDYRIHFWYMIKHDAINIMKNSDFEKSGLL